MLLNVNDSLLLLIDAQEKLMPNVENSQQIIDNCAWMLKLANALNVSVMATEQYPKGLGGTVPALKQELKNQNIPAKTVFSCAADNMSLQEILNHHKQQIILIGIEAHVCVMQSALQLKEQGREVFVVADCISSRNKHDKKFAIKRMRDHQIEIVTKEMVFFEWLRDAKHEKFRELSREFLK